MTMLGLVDIQGKAVICHQKNRCSVFGLVVYSRIISLDFAKPLLSQSAEQMESLLLRTNRALTLVECPHKFSVMQPYLIRE